MRFDTALLWIVMAPFSVGAGERVFTIKPNAETRGGRVKIRFEVSTPTDVEVAIIDRAGTVVRHLAAGMTGNNPPKPLTAGLHQELEWDGRDDFGAPAASGPFRCRVRAGTAFTMGRFIGADPYNFAAVDSLTTDRDGNVYVMGFGGEANQGHMVLRVFNAEGLYLREILPFPADLPPDAVRDITH